MRDGKTVTKLEWIECTDLDEEHFEDNHGASTRGKTKSDSVC
ncbi:uncharacterized protein TANIYAMA4_2609 [Streptococcus canis]|nr:uncharacterized protein TANIYAMA4_2609 [Streptococcus canis]